MAEKEKFLDKFLLDSNFVIFLIPLYGFLFTFCAEVSYAKYFDIPMALIKIDGRNVCNDFIFVLLLFFFIYGVESLLSNFVGPMFKKYKEKNILTRQLWNYIFLEIILLVLIGNIFLFGFKNMITITFLILLILFLFAFLYNHFNPNGFKSRTDYDDIKKESDEIDYSVNFKLISNLLGRKTITILFFTFIIIAMSMSIGEYNAKNQQLFYQINNRYDIAGVTIYGDRLIAKKIESGKLQNGIIIIDITGDTELIKFSLDSFTKETEVTSEDNIIIKDEHVNSDVLEKNAAEKNSEQL